jgi:hypothetical protein
MATSFQNANISVPFTGLNVNCVYTNGTSISIAGTSSGIAYSSNLSTWTFSNIKNYNWTSLSVIGANAVICGSDNQGIYYSSNSGVTWTQSTVTTGNFNFILMTTITSVIRVIACSDSEKGLFYSTDAGASWTNPVTTGNFIMCTSNAASGTNNTIAISKTGSTVNGIYISSNRGSSWAASTTTTAITTLNFNSVSMVGKFALVASTTPANSGDKFGLWYSTNNGTAWTQTTTTSSSDNQYFNSVLLTSSTTFHATGLNCSGIWRSVNTGSTFTQVSTTKQNNIIQNSGTSANLVAFGNDNILSVSSNTGSSWTNSNNTSINAMSLSTSKSIIGKNSGLGLFYSPDSFVTISQALNTTPIIRSLCSSSTNSIITLNPSGIAYSSNSGVDWTLASGQEASLIFQSSSISGTNAVACANQNSLVYYSSNSGQLWSPSSITGTIAGNPNVIYIDGNNACLCSNTSETTGIWYSSDLGATWQVSNITAGMFNDIKISGSVAIACSASNSGIYYSQNSGAFWTQTSTTSIQTLNFVNVQIFGLNAVSSSNGIYYSSDGGDSWNISDAVQSSWFIYNFNDSNVIAGNNNNNGIIYSSNLGVEWIASNKTTLDYQIGHTNGFLSFAGSNSQSNIVQYSSDNGQTYNNTNITGKITGITYNSTTQNALIGGDKLLVYSANIPCFNENTTLLTDSNEYVLISLLKENDILKTYKDGDKKIKYIKSFFIYNDSLSSLNTMYKMKNSDFTISGGHSILVDELDEDEKNIQKNDYGFEHKIHDKHLNLACVSKLFEKIEDKRKFILYHIVLENDDENKNYGVYANGGILTETINEKYYNGHCKNII